VGESCPGGGILSYGGEGKSCQGEHEGVKEGGGGSAADGQIRATNVSILNIETDRSRQELPLTISFTSCSRMHSKSGAKRHTYQLVWGVAEERERV
jgi:hypothetical protein